jgi:hypothetical protein
LKAFPLLCAALAIVQTPEPAYSSGAYEDYGRFSSFLRAPQIKTLDFRLTRTNAAAHDATVILLSGTYPLRSRILLEPELTYVARSSATDVESDFGDGIIRMKSRMFAAKGRALYLLASLRTGSGALTVFPYSTGSVDVEAGLGLVDTVSTFPFWASATATHVTRLNETLKSADAHGSFVLATAGMVIPLGRSFDIQFGGAGYFLTSAGTREVYFSQLDYRATDAVKITFLLQAEGGDPGERVTDYAVGTGVWIAP